MTKPEDLLFSKEHEWVKLDGESATIGITDYAQNALGDIVYVELPKVGTKIEQFSQRRRDRIGQGRFRSLHADVGRSRRNQRWARERSGRGQPRALWRGLAAQDSSFKARRSREPALAGRL